MKKTYIKPSMESETFVPNTYCTVCTNESGVIYKFECNAGNRNTSYNVYFADDTPLASSNGNEEWSAQFTGYHPCYDTHEAESNSGFYNGYMYQQNWRGDNTGERIPIVIWTENGTNVHCTTNLEMDEWDTFKS